MEAEPLMAPQGEPPLVTAENLDYSEALWRLSDALPLPADAADDDVPRQSAKPAAAAAACGLGCLGPAGLAFPGGREELALVTALAATAFDEEDEVHAAVADAVFLRATGALPAARRGPHWGAVGFQGDNPATDLRSVGLFGLLQLLRAIEERRGTVDALRALNEQSPSNFLPLASVSLNCSLAVLRALRGGALDAEANRRQSVLDAAFALHAALLAAFAERVGAPGAVADLGKVATALREVGDAGRTQPCEVVEAYYSDTSSGSGSGSDEGEAPGSPMSVN